MSQPDFCVKTYAFDGETGGGEGDGEIISAGRTVDVENFFRFNNSYVYSLSLIHI